MKHLLIILTGLAIITGACQPKKLPILGEREFINGDSVYHTIPDFQLVDQDSNLVTNKTYENKIYVADFFFTTCPTICPIMKTQMLRIYDKFKDNPEVGILSHTIDPRHDTVAVLKAYARRLGVSGNFWHFVTGDKKTIYELGQKEYMVTANEDSAAAGGYIHSGAFLLVDKKRRIRGQYDGTKEDQVSRLMKDMEVLLKEKE
ncbi:SCO family protein [Emticicia sp. BO119]|uniref:SCO family protein n=1 Tax=Emticicia sp. BO119 TaxID=2757768 RepID=UPI0015F03989|nr:SCO family protein [Emticicia sp. BO119]MBA4852103.1 SCO family protein [Emticicia sp. BO119]